MKNHGYVFVYGSLKIGGHFSANFDKDRVSVTPAKVNGTLYKLRWPGLVLGGEKPVHGELHLYREFRFVVKHMDYIEGYRKRNDDSNLYDKNVVEVETEEGKKVKATVYTLNTLKTSVEGCEIVDDGVWPI